MTALIHGVGEAVLPVEGDEPAVHVAATEPARPGPADERVLHAEGARAPEPVGVPPPQVVLDGEEVLALLAQRLVVNAAAGVIALPRRLVAESADGKVQLVIAERGAVDEI